MTGQPFCSASTRDSSLNATDFSLNAMTDMTPLPYVRLFLECMFGERCLRLSVFGVVLSAHALHRLLGLSLDCALEGERTLDAVALLLVLQRDRLHLELRARCVSFMGPPRGSYPHTPTHPHALQKSQPSLLIS